MQGGHIRTNPACPIQVASVQTLQRRRIPPADVVVVGEAHRLFEFYIRWMAEPEWRRVPFIGLSATPWTRGLGKHFDDLLIAATTADLIEASYLSRFRVFAPSHPDLSGVRIQRGDYVEADLSQAMNKDVLVADIVATWKAKGENRSTLCFAVDRAGVAGLASSACWSASTRAGSHSGRRKHLSPALEARPHEAGPG
jgi:DNA repair protein RadD